MRFHPEVRVVMLSAHIRDAFISASFSAGVSAYFAKSDDLEDIVRGIHDVVASKAKTFILGPKVRERCAPPVVKRGVSVRAGTPRQGEHASPEDAPTTRLECLTARESEILRLIGKGLSRIQIAAQLSRSVKTIDGHQARMMKKVGIATRADLMRFAIREGLAQA
jgi:DNA-binding NarL/FixJ family response regulator